MLHVNDNTSPAAARRNPLPAFSPRWASPVLRTCLTDLRRVVATQLHREDMVPRGIAGEHAAELALLDHLMAIATERDPLDVPDLLQAALSGTWCLPDPFAAADMG